MKPNKEMIFRYVGGRFVNMSGDSEILADVLHELNIEVDEKCEFARFKDYVNNRSIFYRAFDGKITIQIWNIQ